MEKIKSIAFRLNLNGNGIVNFDSNDQKWFLSKHCGYTDNELGNIKDKNISFCKKVFFKRETPILMGYYKDGNPIYNDTDFYIKISSNCLRNAIFANDIEVMNPKVLMSDYVTAYYLTSEHSLLRGFTGLGKSEISYIKKSCLTMPAAIDKTAKPYIEINSNSSPKEKIDEEKGSTSMFFTENVGETNYTTNGFISLKDMQFVSCDEFLGRLGFDPKWLEGDNPLLNQMFIKHYGKIPFKSGYFSSATVTMSEKIGEFGIHFTKEFTIELLKGLLSRILNINIKRAGAYAATSSLQIRFITDNCKNANLSTDNDWITVNNDFIENLDKILVESDYDVFDFYDELSEEEISQTRGEINKILKEQQEAEKKAAKKTAKEAKTVEE